MLWRLLQRDGSVGLGSVSMTETVPRSLLDPTISFWTIWDSRSPMSRLSGWHQDRMDTWRHQYPQRTPTGTSSRIDECHNSDYENWLGSFSPKPKSATCGGAELCLCFKHTLSLSIWPPVHQPIGNNGSPIKYLTLFFAYPILFLMVHTHTPIDVGSEKGLPNIATYWNTQKQS